jgi:hypothetical protein
MWRIATSETMNRGHAEFDGPGQIRSSRPGAKLSRDRTFKPAAFSDRIEGRVPSIVLSAKVAQTTGLALSEGGAASAIADAGGSELPSGTGRRRRLFYARSPVRASAEETTPRRSSTGRRHTA